MKRKDYIDWDTYFMGVAALASMRSKDPNTQHGACIVDPVSNNIISVGYNGFPRDCSDEKFPWTREGEHSWETKYDYVIHAERNALDLATSSVEDSVMYLFSPRGYYPCAHCAQGIVQNGIGELVMAIAMTEDSDKYSWEATKRMFAASRVHVRMIEEPLKLFQTLFIQFEKLHQNLVEHNKL